MSIYIVCILAHFLLTQYSFFQVRLAWILRNNKEVMHAYKEGDLMFGTLDSWLVYKLNGGGIHVTEPSNAISTGDDNYEIIMRSYKIIP